MHSVIVRFLHKSKLIADVYEVDAILDFYVGMKSRPHS